MLKDIIKTQIGGNHPCCVSPRTPVREVARIMRDEDVGCVIVTNPRGEPIGMITDRDLATRCLADSLSPEHALAQEVMSSSPITIRQDAGLYDSIRAMHDARVRRVPVVDNAGRAVGIISFGDILGILSKEFGALVENCTHPLSTETETAQKAARKSQKIA